MKSVAIRNTDLTLSGICFGTSRAGTSPGWDGAAADRLFEEYVAAGGNIIDTARVYSDWIPGERSRSERVVGDWLRRRGRRDDVIVMTKGGHPELSDMSVSRMSGAEMTADLEGSLKTLGLDYIDIYLYHRDDTSHPVEELIERMEDFRRAGKIRYYGCSNWTVPRMAEAERYCAGRGYRGFVVNEAQYSAATAHMSRLYDKTLVVCGPEMLRFHETSDILLMPYTSLSGGFFHRLAARGTEAVEKSDFYSAENLKIAEKLYGLCRLRGYGVTQALLGFFAAHTVPMVPIFAVSSEEHLKEATDALHTEYVKEDYGFCLPKY